MGSIGRIAVRPGPGCRALAFCLALCCLLAAFPCPALAAGPEDPEQERITLKVPERVLLGAPFLVRLTSLDTIDEAVFHWRGRQVVPAVSVWNGKHVALAMLGTDVLTDTLLGAAAGAPGPSPLVLTAVVEGREESFTREVEVLERPLPEEPDRAAPALSPAEAARAEVEAREAAQAMDAASSARRWFLPFDKPVDAPVTGLYGSECSVGGRQTFRRGVDFALEPGTPVRACGSGTVVLAADHLAAGRSVYLDHGNGVVSMYFHLLRADVTVGQSLTRGDVLGLSGATGRPHVPKLHFAVAVQGRLVDPEPLFNNNADDLLPE
ncbi:MAG: M23 family metallopeptidase [Desulfovibrionaceae bacterium]